MKSFFALSILLAASSFGVQVHAIAFGPYFVEGKIKSFDNDHLKLETEQSIVEIPRKIVAIKTLKSGSLLRVSFLEEDLGLLKFEIKK